MAHPESTLPSRLLLAAIVLLAVAALYFRLIQPHITSIPKSIREPMEEVKPAPPPAPELPPLSVPAIPNLEPPSLTPTQPIEATLPPPSEPGKQKRRTEEK